MCDRFLYPDDNQGLGDAIDIVKSEPFPEKSGEVLDREAHENLHTHNFSLAYRGSTQPGPNGGPMLFADDGRSAEQGSPVVTHQAVAAQARAAVAPESTPAPKDRRTLRKRSYKGYAGDSPPEATPKAKYDPIAACTSAAAATYLQSRIRSLAECDYYSGRLKVCSDELFSSANLSALLLPYPSIMLVEH